MKSGFSYKSIQSTCCIYHRTRYLKSLYLAVHCIIDTHIGPTCSSSHSKKIAHLPTLSTLLKHKNGNCLKLTTTSATTTRAKLLALTYEAASCKRYAALRPSPVYDSAHTFSNSSKHGVRVSSRPLPEPSPSRRVGLPPGDTTRRSVAAASGESHTKNKW